MKEHHVNTTDIELIDAVLSAPTGLHGLASDMADLAQREPTHPATHIRTTPQRPSTCQE